MLQCHVMSLYSSFIPIQVSNIYHVPLILEEQNIHGLIRARLRLEGTMSASPDLSSWRDMAMNVDVAAQNVKLALSDEVCLPL